MNTRFAIREDYLHYNRYWFDEDEERQIVEALRSGWITRGPKTAEFEERFAAYLGNGGQLLGTNSCTAALHLALLAAGIGPGDEVIVPPMTFAATANVCEHLGARPVFVDVRPGDLTLDPAAVAAALTGATRAVIAVHYAGFQADLPALAALLRPRGIVLIEDAAHSIEGEIGGRRAGAYSDYAAFSFYATKNMASGEGGALWCREPARRDEAAVLSLHGMSRDAWRRYEGGASPHYDIVRPGYKYNMFDLQAALLLAQLDKLPLFQQQREMLARRYHQILGQEPRLRLLHPAGDTRAAWHLYPVILEAAGDGEARDALIQAMHRRRVGCSLHFIPLHLMRWYRERYGLPAEHCPEALRAYRGLVSLPLYPRMREEDVDYVCAALQDVLNERDEL